MYQKLLIYQGADSCGWEPPGQKGWQGEVLDFKIK